MVETTPAEKYNRRKENIERAYKVCEANYLKKLKAQTAQTILKELIKTSEEFL